MNNGFKVLIVMWAIGTVIAIVFLFRIFMSPVFIATEMRYGNTTERYLAILPNHILENSRTLTPDSYRSHSPADKIIDVQTDGVQTIYTVQHAYSLGKGSTTDQIVREGDSVIKYPNEQRQTIYTKIAPLPTVWHWTRQLFYVLIVIPLNEHCYDEYCSGW